MAAATTCKHSKYTPVDSPDFEGSCLAIHDTIRLALNFLSSIAMLQVTRLFSCTIVYPMLCLQDLLWLSALASPNLQSTLYRPSCGSCPRSSAPPLHRDVDGLWYAFLDYLRSPAGKR